MKKLTLFTLFLCTIHAVFAATPNFKLDENSVQAEFSELNKIESFVIQNEGITLSELQENHADVVADIELIEETSTVLSMGEMPLVGGFWWGCCLGIVGLALVYFITDNDKEQVKSALIGCVLFTVIGGGLYGFLGNPLNWF